jgi:hypothetical protein
LADRHRADAQLTRGCGKTAELGCPSEIEDASQGLHIRMVAEDRFNCKVKVCIS